MIFYNSLLQDSKGELTRLIAAVDSETRTKTIKTLFLDVVRVVHNESIITKHEVSEEHRKQFRVVPTPDPFVFQKLRRKLLRTFDPRHHNVSSCCWNFLP